MSLRAHANFVIAMLVAGVLTSLVLNIAEQMQAAWIVAVVFAGCACGALFRLSLRLPDADVQDARDAN
jgi:archaellum component FlaG (FlaF/FlaG flagellin family)